ncbi:MAG: DUF1926 domain-containing protein [Candidatus Lokiarchaeota archaeon]|nr:DUF1926 domain-containing protein [Candidatus Lokiarchaeota archaeon]
MNSQEKVNFSLVFHFHQPVDNFNHVIEHAYQKSYLPLIERIEKYPKLKIGLHYTGSLLDWIIEFHPEYLDILRSLRKNNQIEIIGGGYYEPIIAVIPDEDKINQIELMRNLIKDEFDLEIEGFWLAERVWEPHLPKILNQCNLKYILIDDFHLRANGLSEEDTFFPYLTEEQGNKVVVVPINEPLRYMTPWKMVEESINYLNQFKNSEGNRLITLIDDAEKMGVWPAGDRTTYDICFGSGYDGTAWIDKFFNALTTNKWINSITISDYLNKFLPKGLIYMPTASYDKMSYWVLPTPARKSLESLVKQARNNELHRSQELLQFLKGGIWRHFFVKYPESNNMHKKMLYVRNKVEKSKELIKNEDIKKEILREIYKSQCNDGYWHGQFGGVYFSFMRESIYKHLIKAEKILQDNLKKFNISICKIFEEDITFDGRPELIFENENANLYLQPHYGGSIYELDNKLKTHNFLNVFTRKKEAYHDPNSGFTVDRWKKHAFLDHFLQNEIEDVEEFAKDTFKEAGSFIGSTYNYEILSEKENKLKVKLFTRGKIKKFIEDGLNDIFIEIQLIKEVLLLKNSIKITYMLKNLSKENLKTFHYIEIPFYLDADLSKSRIISNDFETDLLTTTSWEAKNVLIQNKEKDLELSISLQRILKINSYALFTYASTDGGFDSLYQGSVIGVQIPVDLNPNEPISYEINLKF